MSLGLLHRGRRTGIGPIRTGEFSHDLEELERTRGIVGNVDIAGQFSRANKAHVADLLETLVAVGQARVTPGGEYAP